MFTAATNSNGRFYLFIYLFMYLFMYLFIYLLFFPRVEVIMTYNDIRA